MIQFWQSFIWQLIVFQASLISPKIQQVEMKIVNKHTSTAGLKSSVKSRPVIEERDVFCSVRTNRQNHPFMNCNMHYLFHTLKDKIILHKITVSKIILNRQEPPYTVKEWNGEGLWFVKIAC